MGGKKRREAKEKKNSKKREKKASCYARRSWFGLEKPVSKFRESERDPEYRKGNQPKTEEVRRRGVKTAAAAAAVVAAIYQEN